METQKHITRVLSIALMLAVCTPMYAATPGRIALYKKCIAKRCNAAEKAIVRSDLKKAGAVAGALLLAAGAAIGVRAYQKNKKQPLAAGFKASGQLRRKIEFVRDQAQAVAAIQRSEMQKHMKDFEKFENDTIVQEYLKSMDPEAAQALPVYYGQLQILYKDLDRAYAQLVKDANGWLELLNTNPTKLNSMLFDIELRLERLDQTQLKYDNIEEKIDELFKYIEAQDAPRTAVKEELLSKIGKVK